MTVIINLRQRIITALKTALATIKTNAGYETSLSAKQIREWETFSIEDLTGISNIIVNIRDFEQHTEITYQQDVHVMMINLEAYFSGITAPEIFRKFAADLITFVRINRTTGTLGSLIQDLELDELDTVEMLHGTQKIAKYNRNIIITYTTANYNAYN